MWGFSKGKQNGQSGAVTIGGRKPVAEQNTRGSNQPTRPVRAPRTSWHLCVVGGDVENLPPVSGITYERRLSKNTDALLAMPGANPSRMFRGLWANQRSLLPVIDAIGNLPRADARIRRITEETLREALSEIEDARNLLDDIPEIPSEQREEFLVLAMAYSRQQQITAQWAPHKPGVTAYPTLTGIPFSNERLENLANDGLLQRSFFQRVHECSHCDSARLIAQEECESCHSSNIQSLPLIHHYSCGHQGLRSQFVQGERLVCPKCNERLRHYGVDYDISGDVTHCNDCGHQSGDVEVGFTCMDCGEHTAGKDAATRDIYHYDLTADGRQAVLSGALPGLLGQIGEPARIISVEEFDRLVIIEGRRTRRSNRPHVVLRVTLQASSKQIERLGMASINALYKQAAEVTAERLRDSDLLAWRGPQIYVLMPDTPPENVQVVVNKLSSSLHDLFGIDPSFAMLSGGEETDVTVEANWSDLSAAA
ncbi:MAG: hypothetical protein KI792_00700 [Alphaproteobacteria bacterium]|nr:hypothetical protein [Alphaproteobacteria bacterium SS10]